MVTRNALPAGAYWVDVPCPKCGELVPLPLFLYGSLTIEADSSTLRLKAKCDKSPHGCGQRVLTIDSDNELSLDAE
jgi:hypothetical protein